MLHHRFANATQILLCMENMKENWMTPTYLDAGEAVITEPVVDLQQDAATGQPRLALALTPLHKLQANNPNSNKQDKKPAPVEPATDVALTGTVKAPRGGLEVVKGKIILPRDAATAIGPSVFVDVSVGRFAIEENELLASSVNEHRGKVPVRGNLYSDRAQAGGLGFLSLRRGQVELLQPLKAEVNIQPLQTLVSWVHLLLVSILRQVMNSRERKRITGFSNLVCQVHLNELESTHGRHLGKPEAS